MGNDAQPPPSSGTRFETVAPRPDDRRGLGSLWRFVVLIGVAFEGNIECLISQLKSWSEYTRRKRGVRLSAVRSKLPGSELGGKTNGLGSVKIDSSTGSQIEFIAQLLNKHVFVGMPARGNLTTEQYQRVTIDSRNRRTSVDERWKDRECMPMVREVHVDPRPHVCGAIAARQLLRRNREIYRLLELGEDLGHQVDSICLTKISDDRQSLKKLACCFGLTNRS